MTKIKCRIITSLIIVFGCLVIGIQMYYLSKSFIYSKNNKEKDEWCAKQLKSTVLDFIVKSDSVKCELNNRLSDLKDSVNIKTVIIEPVVDIDLNSKLLYHFNEIARGKEYNYHYFEILKILDLRSDIMVMVSNKKFTISSYCRRLKILGLNKIHIANIEVRVCDNNITEIKIDE